MRTQKENLCRLVIQFKLLLGVCVVFFTAATHAVTLEEAIETALKVDPSLRASKFNVLATGENIAIARSRLLPQVSLQGSSNQLTQTTTQELSSGGSSSRSFTGPTMNHQFVIRQALLRPKELSALRYAELQSQYMELKFKSDVKDLRNRVINAWIDLLGAQQIARAYEKPLNLMLIAAKQELAKYEQGDSTKDAVLEAQAQYENSKATHIQAFETLKNKQSVFENLTKIPALALAEKNLRFESLPIFTESDKSLLWANIQDTSLEIQMAKLQEKMQLERLKMAEAEHKPTLDLLAAVNLAQNDATSTQGYQYRNRQVGVQYTVPLYGGGGLAAGARQASLAYEASLAESEALLVRLENDFDSSWGLVIANSSRQKAMLIGLASSREQVNSNRRSFELGVKSIAESANAELSFARKMSEVIAITQEYLKSLLKVNHKSLSLSLANI
jgi:protease secretion system outer membrane protein